MDKIKYDSLYKFIVSIGIAIISLPFIFMVWIFNSDDILMIKENELRQLTNTAQEVVKMEQNYKYILLTNNLAVISISLIMLLIGVVIVIYGVLQWKRKVQNNEDKSMELSNELLEKQIKGLTKQERQEKLKEEIKEIEPIQQKNITFENYNSKVKKYIEVRNCVYREIEKIFCDYKIFTEVKIEKERYDCIAVNQEKFGQDYIFEIKYFSNAKLIKVKSKEITSKMRRRKIAYGISTHRLVENITIIIVDSPIDKSKLENPRVFRRINEHNEKYKKYGEIIITDIESLEDELEKYIKKEYATIDF